MIAKPKRLIPFTSLKSVDNNGIVNRINEGVEVQAKRKKERVKSYKYSQKYSCMKLVTTTCKIPPGTSMVRGAANVAFPSGYHGISG